MPAVDGLRGLLALVVLLKHATGEAGLHSQWLHQASQLAVLMFFLLSGYVLTRGWASDVPTFLIRRFTRLWPVYAVTLAVAFVVRSWPFDIGLFVWYPLYVLDGRTPNLPAWSLHVEAWAMLAMPFFVWASRSLPRTLVGFAAIAIVGFVQPMLAFGYFFLAGAYLSRWEFRQRFLESAIPQWLGRISYSLYLTHWLFLITAHRYFGPVAALASVPLVFVLAWCTWRWIELPSIRLSRRIRLPSGLGLGWMTSRVRPT